MREAAPPQALPEQQRARQRQATREQQASALARMVQKWGPSTSEQLARQASQRTRQAMVALARRAAARVQLVRRQAGAVQWEPAEQQAESEARDVRHAAQAA